VKLKGTFRITTDDRTQLHTLEYMAGPDHPGYGVWEPVLSRYDITVLSDFMANPPAWWGQS
jgi:hypothetical protein